MKTKLILVTILVIGLGLRVVNLGSNPPSLSWDEVSHGYNAYSILKTGQDEWGQWLPISNFRAYGDYPTTLYMYMSMPFIATLGLNAWVIRLPSAIMGTVLILGVYLLAKQLFKKETVGLLAAGLVAISPWGLLTSRQVLQATPAVTLLVFGLWFFLTKRLSGYLVGTVCLGLSAYAYHNTRILAPVVFGLLLLNFWRRLMVSKKVLVGVVVIGLVFFGPLVPVLTSSEGSARAVWVGILDQGAINHINQSRGMSPLPGPLPKLVNNKYTYFATVTVVNYLGYFSPLFLAWEGGTHYQFSVQHFGLIYPIELPFFYLGLGLGLVGLVRRWRRVGELELVTILVLAAPLPAAITRDPSQVVRALTMMPFVHLLAGFGAVILYNFLKSRWQMAAPLAAAVSGVVVIVLAASYLNNLYRIYPIQYSFAWQYGYQQAVDYILANQDSYPRVVMTKKYGEPHEFLLFFSQYDPAKYRNDPNLVRYNLSDWFWVDRFSKYEFINDWEIRERLVGQKGVLLVTNPGNYPSQGQLLKTIDYLDGQPAFDIVKL